MARTRWPPGSVNPGLLHRTGRSDRQRRWLYDAVNHGQVNIAQLRRSLAALPLPRAADGRLMLAVDVSNWLRPGAVTSPDRLFCHVYGRGKGQAQMIPGWLYSVIAALEPGRTSWTAVLDAIRLGPDDDEAEVTAAQVREVISRLIARGTGGKGTRPSW
jgi:DDE superfamily endonuclease